MVGILGDAAAIGPLEELARKQFADLTEREGQCLDAIATGKDFVGDTPANLGDAVRAALVRWLCLDAGCAKHIHARGIRLVRQHISGLLDLSFLKIGYPLAFSECTFDGHVDLSDAQMMHLHLTECHLHALTAIHMEASGAVRLDGSHFDGPIRLQGCRIRSNLRLIGAQLRGRGGPSLNLEGAVIGGAVLMTGKFVAIEGVRFFGSSVQRNIECAGTIAGSGPGLLIEGTKVGGSVLLRRGFRCLGGVRIWESKIEGSLDMQGARLASRGPVPALLVYGSSVAKSLLLRSDTLATGHTSICRVIGSVVVQSSVVEGNLDFSGAHVRGSRLQALSLFDAAVRGRLVANKLDLVGRLVLTRAKVSGDIELADATLSAIQDATLSGNGLRCDGTIDLGGARITGRINLAYLALSGEFRAESLSVQVDEGVALSMPHAKLGGSITLARAIITGRLDLRSSLVAGFVDLRKATIHGVDLPYTAIGSSLMLDEATLVVSSGLALSFEYGDCKGSVTARQLTSSGELRLTAAVVGGNITLSGATLVAWADVALGLDNIRCGGSIVAQNLTCKGGLRLISASVGGNIALTACMLDGMGGPALAAVYLNLVGIFLFNNGTAKGRFHFPRSTIGGDLDFSGSMMSHDSGAAVAGDNSVVGGSVRLTDGFAARGEVSFNKVSVEGNFNLGPCRLRSPAGRALSLKSAKIRGSFAAGYALSLRVPWEGSRLLGMLDLSSANIADDVDLSDVQLFHARGTALSLCRASVAGSLHLDECFRANGSIDLRNAELHGIEDDEASWPCRSGLLLDGLTYLRLSPLVARDRLRWIQLQPDPAGSGSSWQPFEQLTQILRQQGREGDARLVLIAKERTATRTIQFRPQRWLSHLYGWVMGFGYAPQRALVAVVPLVAILSATFYLGGDDLMVPTNDQARSAWTKRLSLPMGYPQFSPIAYSVDTLIPILSLQQKDTWRPAAEIRCSSGPRDCGLYLRVALWVYIALGWIITTLTVAGFTGLIRKS